MSREEFMERQQIKQARMLGDQVKVSLPDPDYGPTHGHPVRRQQSDDEGR